MLLHINGTDNTDTANFDNLDSVSIERVGDNQIQLVTEDDHSLVVTRESNNLIVVVALDFSLFGSTLGLLGNWSDTFEDDFIIPNGTNLGYPLTDEQIHNDFGETCKYISIKVSVFLNLPLENCSGKEVYQSGYT